MTEEEIKNMISEWNTCEYKGRYFEMFAVISDSSIVGYISAYEQRYGVVSFGFKIFSAYRRNGYASEAVELLSSYVRDKGYILIEDQVRADNAVSIMLHEKLGFKSDMMLTNNSKGHDVYIYTRLLGKKR